MSDEYRPPRRSWPKRFGNAFRGMWRTFRHESSFRVHWVFAVAVIVAAAVLKLSLPEWCLLLLCITIVFAAEMLNTALEHLAKAIDRTENQHIATALDIGSAAVLVAAIGAVVVGCIVFVAHVAVWWNGRP